MILGIKPISSIYKILLFSSFVTNSFATNYINISNLKDIPRNETIVHIHDSSHIKNLKGLPRTTEILTITNCPYLNSLKGIPETVETLIISKCQNLISLKGLPNNKINLTLYKCAKLSLSIKEIRKQYPNLGHVDVINEETE